MCYSMNLLFMFIIVNLHNGQIIIMLYCHNFYHIFMRLQLPHSKLCQKTMVREKSPDPNGIKVVNGSNIEVSKVTVDIPFIQVIETFGIIFERTNSSLINLHTIPKLTHLIVRTHLHVQVAHSCTKLIRTINAMHPKLPIIAH